MFFLFVEVDANAHQVSGGQGVIVAVIDILGV
jgi:hypothetical protein